MSEPQGDDLTIDECRVLIRELMDSLTRERQTVYQLTRRNEELRPRAIAAEAIRGEMPALRAALAAVSWAESLDEAKAIADDALKGVNRVD